MIKKVTFLGKTKLVPFFSIQATLNVTEDFEDKDDLLFDIDDRLRAGARRFTLQSVSRKGLL